MVIDSSALIAILLGEKEAEVFAKSIALDPKRLMSSLSALETSIVIETKKVDAGGRECDLLMYKTGIEIVSFDQKQYELAKRAWQVFGKGHHPAGLNIGDCCTYALYKFTGEPLLFKGNDFSQTDLISVSLPE